MSFFAQDCCCQCEPPIVGTFVPGSDPGPDWEVVSGSAPTFDQGVRLSTPNTIVIHQRHFIEPYMNLGIGGAPSYVAGKDRAVRLIFDFHDVDRYQFFETIWSSSLGGYNGCGPYTRPSLMRFGSVGSGGTSYQAETHAYGFYYDWPFDSLCIRPDGLVWVRPYFDGALPSLTSGQFAIRTEVTSPRIGFGLGPQTNLDSWINSFGAIAFSDDPAKRVNCVECIVNPTAMASRFIDHRLPDELEITLPPLDGTPLGKDCSCHAGTYYVPRNLYSDYSMEFPITCDENGRGCDGVEGNPFHDVLQIKVFGGPSLLIAVHRIIYSGLFEQTYFWRLSDIGHDLDASDFELTVPPDNTLYQPGCENTQSATVRGVA